MRRGDTTGLALFLIWQVEAGLVSAEEAAHLLGVTPRTVLEHCVLSPVNSYPAKSHKVVPLWGQDPLNQSPANTLTAASR